MNPYPVALLVFTPLILVLGVVSMLRLQAKPPSIAWVLSGYAVLAVPVAEPIYFMYLVIFGHDPNWGRLLDPDLLPFWIVALVYLAALAGTAYAIAAQRWGRREHEGLLLVGFTVVLLLFTLSVVLRLGMMH